MKININEKENQQRLRAIKTNLFGARFADSCLSKVDNLDQASQKKLSDFMENPKNFLVLCGSPGIGKTYFCAALMEWTIKKFDFYRYWNEKILFQKLRETFGEKGDYISYLHYMLDSQLVIIDDIGSQKPSEWKEEVLFDAIDIRYNSMMPTIITSNLTKNEFEKLYHPRLASRLFAAENVIIEEKSGYDKRKAGY